MAVEQRNYDHQTDVAGASFSSRRARILVTMLGADFAKSTQHPFFSRLVELATRESGDPEPLKEDTNLSATLQALVDRLNSSRATETLQPVIEKEVETTPASFTQSLSSDALEFDHASLRDQHPAVIACTAQNLSDSDCTALLKSLPGATARQVISILSAL